MLLALIRQPHLWNADDFRTTYPGTPHGEADDILLRYTGPSAHRSVDTVIEDDRPVWLPAARLLDIVRTHWTIENQLHWVLDVVFDEDRARNRKDNGPENLATLRKLALNIIRAHPAKMSMRQKSKRAGWDDSFLLGVLSHMR